jgi:transcription elongation GreA/GreB family factor
LFRRSIEKLKKDSDIKLEPLVAKVAELEEWLERHRELIEREEALKKEMTTLNEELKQQKFMHKEESVCDRRAQIREKTAMRNAVEAESQATVKHMASLEEAELSIITAKTDKSNNKLANALTKYSRETKVGHHYCDISIFPSVAVFEIDSSFECTLTDTEMPISCMMFDVCYFLLIFAGDSKLLTRLGKSRPCKLDSTASWIYLKVW